jgi:cystathionine beta-lyase/cystathionine gamma-synthase
MKHHFDTLLIHSGEKSDPQTGAVAPVLYRTKTYAQKFGKDQTYQYSRGKNPTRVNLEEKLAALEGCKHAVTFASGNAATTAFLMTLNPGDHILFCQEIYGGTYRIVEQVMNRFGITADYGNFITKESIKARIKPNTKYLFVETPTNPSLHIIDLELVAEVSKETGVPFVVDSTFSPPCTTQPIKYGAKVVIQSLSKYIAGHNDVLAGALMTDDNKLYEEFYFLFRTCGAILSPDECYRILQGIKTLSMRWERVSNTAHMIARNLESVPNVKKVYYPYLSSHYNHVIAYQQMASGAGGVLSFELQDKFHTPEKIKQFVDTVTKSGLIIYAESLASPETILAYPPLMSHRSLPDDVRKSLGISDGFFRLSVGFENEDEIFTTLKESLVKL